MKGTEKSTHSHTAFSYAFQLPGSFPTVHCHDLFRFTNVWLKWEIKAQFKNIKAHQWGEMLFLVVFRQLALRTTHFLRKRPFQTFTTFTFKSFCNLLLWTLKDNFPHVIRWMQTQKLQRVPSRQCCALVPAMHTDNFEIFYSISSEYQVWLHQVLHIHFWIFNHVLNHSNQSKKHHHHNPNHRAFKQRLTVNNLWLNSF